MLSNRERLKLVDGLCLCFHDGREDFESAKKILDQIYRVAHPHEGCQHEDWDHESHKLARKLKKWGIVDIYKEE
jgi:hypothetical protein